jgi:hypothetical protein
VTRRVNEIVSGVVSSTDVPATLDGLSRHDRQGLEARAAHLGITPQEALARLHAAKAAKAEEAEIAEIARVARDRSR